MLVEKYSHSLHHFAAFRTPNQLERSIFQAIYKEELLLRRLPCFCPTYRSIFPPQSTVQHNTTTTSRIFPPPCLHTAYPKISRLYPPTYLTSRPLKSPPPRQAKISRKAQAPTSIHKHTTTTTTSSPTARRFWTKRHRESKTLPAIGILQTLAQLKLLQDFALIFGAYYLRILTEQPDLKRGTRHFSQIAIFPTLTLPSRRFFLFVVTANEKKHHPALTHNHNDSFKI